MQLEDEEWVAHALLDYERKRCISKVLSFDCTRALPKGSNYMSDLYRISMKVVLHSGEVVNRSFIYKSMPQTTERKKFIKEAQFDKKEAMLFDNILPDMERIRQAKDHGVERLSPVCYGIRKDLKGYLLEDLNVLGFRMADRNALLDFNHAKLLMQAHAQFHATSAVLIQRGELSPKEFGDMYFRDHKASMERFVLPSLEVLAKHIEQCWGSEWSHYGEKLREFEKTAYSQYSESTTLNEGDFNALLHGDCWLTNMMFRYDSDGMPQNIRLLDFQMCHYNTVAMDLQYFMNTSLNAETYRRRGELIRFYFENLSAALDLYGYTGDKPTLEQISESYKRTNAFGLITGLTYLPFIMQPQDDIPDDLEEWMKEYGTNKETMAPKFSSKVLKDVLQELLKHGTSAGVF